MNNVDIFIERLKKSKWQKVNNDSELGKRIIDWYAFNMNFDLEDHEGEIYTKDFKTIVVVFGPILCTDVFYLDEHNEQLFLLNHNL